MEVLIVALVLAITAWVLVPQFSQAANNGRLHALSAEMQALRAQIERYRVDHGGRYPDAANFVAQMTGRTGLDGTRRETKGEGPTFGPYLRQIPVNPLTGGNRVGAASDKGRASEPARWS